MNPSENISKKKLDFSNKISYFLSSKQQAASSKQQAASSKQQAASSKQQAASSKQQAASSKPEPRPKFRKIRQSPFRFIRRSFSVA